MQPTSEKCCYLEELSCKVKENWFCFNQNLDTSLQLHPSKQIWSISQFYVIQTGISIGKNVAFSLGIWAENSL